MLRALRGFLVALVAVVGTVASADGVPKTYTAAGRIFINRIEQMFPQTDIAPYASAYDHASDTQSTYTNLDVAWTTPNNFRYTGAVTVDPGNGYHVPTTAIIYFYTGYCQTRNASDCGRLAKDSSQKAVTGTSLDAWWDYKKKYGNYNYPDVGSHGATAQFSPELDFYCYNGYKKYEFGGNTGQTYVYPNFYGYYAGSVVETSNGESRTIDTYTGDSAGGTTGWLNQKTDQYCGVPKIQEWYDGAYYARNEFPDYHRDAYRGLQIVIEEVQADVERSHNQLILLNGWIWNPTPSGDSLEPDDHANDPPAPAPTPTPTGTGGTSTGGTSSGGTGVPDRPGDCFAGGSFFEKLINPLCVTVHDAFEYIKGIPDLWFTPKQDWASKWAALNNEKNDHLPFSAGRFYQILKDQVFNESPDSCPLLKITVPSPVSAAGIEKDVNICDNIIASYMHGDFRLAMLFIVGVLMAFVVFKWVMKA